MNRTTGFHTVMLLACLIAVLALANYSPVLTYVQAVKSRTFESAQAFDSRNASEQLLGWLEAEAVKLRIEPIDALNDRVWKAIPGYNGREADVLATHKLALSTGWLPGSTDPVPWVFKELEPRKQLKDIQLQPIYRGNPAKPMVALMINVAWGEEYLAPMLKMLEEEGVHATFFFDGTWLSKHMDLAKQIKEAGHELSNHAYTHPSMSKLNYERQLAEISKTETLLKQLEANNSWFAPPSGDFNATTVRAAYDLGLRTVLWTLDTVDWKKPTPSDIVTRIEAGVSPGTLILMHPTASAQGALAGIIKVIKQKGYTPGTVSATLSSSRID